jgi:antitoxin (DNA-binding transcriptional repressor) of toxin-antitoxin stability system
MTKGWKIGEAKQRFSEVVREAADEPQWIYKRDRLVAAVVDAESLATFLEWKRRRERRTLADAFEELRRIRGDEAWIEVPPRRDRPNPFAR